MEVELSTKVREYLSLCGLSESEIAQCNGGTRMYHDLGLYGDIAETYMGVLVDHYHVDLTGFEFEKYFPPEFVGKDLLTRTALWLLPFIGNAVRGSGECLPLTLEMVDGVMRSKRWGHEVASP